MNQKDNSITQMLKDSPLFALSSGSKELSHSNFWKWLIDIDIDGKHPFIEVFFPDFYKKGNNQYKRVEREEGNRDLTIYFTDGNGNEKCYVIENKLKSVPRRSQLDDYEIKLKENKNVHMERGLLTGIRETLGLGYMWGFLSYSEIADRIKSINKKIEKKIAFSNIIYQYANDIMNISNLLEAALKDYSPEEYYVTNAPKDLSEIKLDDIFLKLCAEMLKKEFEEKINQSQELESKVLGKPVVEVSFNHKKATISCIYKELYTIPGEKEQKEKARLGIQLEGNQFRIYGGPGYRESPLKKKEALYKAFLEKGWFENYNRDEKKIRNKPSSMRNTDCNKYETAEYTHLYQYWNIEEKSDVKTLWAEIESELRNAKDLIDSAAIAF